MWRHEAKVLRHGVFIAHVIPLLGKPSPVHFLGVRQCKPVHFESSGVSYCAFS